MFPRNSKPTPPGQVLLHEFLIPKGISEAQLAKKLRVSLQHVNTLINGKRAMTAQTALLLSRELKTSPELWMSLQNAVDLYQAKRNLQPTR